jgi:hypothetical protein
VGDRFGGVAAAGEPGGDGGDLTACLLGDAFAVVLRVEPFGVGKRIKEELPGLGTGRSRS